jgi:hypothetical protein
MSSIRLRMPMRRAEASEDSRHLTLEVPNFRAVTKSFVFLILNH